MEQKISTYKINKVAKGIILSLEEFMDNCSVSLAKSMVKFWLCTGPNPILVKDKYINPPEKAKSAAADMSQRLHPSELISFIKLCGTQAECEVMYKVYAYFYKGVKSGHNERWKDGCIFGGGFLYDILKAKATGKKVKMSWTG